MDSLKTPLIIPEEWTMFPYKAKSILGDSISMSDYRGKVILVVNVASQCGHTWQYAGLQKLFDRYREMGFIVLVFPSNDFGEQEPGSNSDILTFCKNNYQINFPIFSKIMVRGKDQHPLYRFLTDEKMNQVSGEPIRWNFQKILVGKNGMVIRSFIPSTKPEDQELKEAIENALKN